MRERNGTEVRLSDLLEIVPGEGAGAAQRVAPVIEVADNQRG